MKKRKLIAVLSALVLPLLFFVSDYIMRMANGDIRSGGFNDQAGDILIYIFAGLIGLSLGYLTFHRSKVLSPFIAAAGSWLGYWYVGFGGLLYVCGAGIDCI